MTGVEVLAGAAAMYLVRKLRRVGGRADAEVDRALDAGMDAVHDLVTGRLGQDPAVTALRELAPAGKESERTVRRVTDAIADAAEADPDFAERLARLVHELRSRENAVAPRQISVGGNNTGIISIGDGATNVQVRGETPRHGTDR
jgi:hypothetical protein